MNLHFIERITYFEFRVLLKSTKLGRFGVEMISTRRSLCVEQGTIRQIKWRLRVGIFHFQSKNLKYFSYASLPGRQVYVLIRGVDSKEKNKNWAVLFLKRWNCVCGTM